MARSALEHLGPRVSASLVVGPVACASAGGGQVPGPAEVLEADHPIPTARNVASASRAEAFVRATGDDETLLLLLSGGASAMLCSPRPPLTLGNLRGLTDALLRAGATINELNAVRKHLEVLKGGGLLRAAVDGRADVLTASPRVVTLVLSDVLGDRLDVIGSGPTAPDPTTFEMACGVIERYGLAAAVPAATALLGRGRDGALPETLKPDEPASGFVRHVVIGNNRLAIDAACEAASRSGFAVVGRREHVEGEAAEVASSFVADAVALEQTLRSAAETKRGARGACLVWGGETTVSVGEASGTGGRNQEFCLAAAIDLAERAVACVTDIRLSGITILSLATDGRDGPTDAAGGVVDSRTCALIEAAGLDPHAALSRHDSYTALDAAGALLQPGLTGTNINDVMVALVET